MNVLLVSSSEGIALQLAGILHAHGHRAHVFTIWHSAEFVRWSRRCASYAKHVLPGLLPNDVEPVMGAIADQCRARRIDMIVPAGLWGTCVVAKLKDRFPVPFVFPIATPEQIYRLHNKWTLHGSLNALGLPTPATRWLQLAELPSTVYPIILKPPTGGGSNSVVVCDTPADVERARAASVGVPLLLQEWIAGTDAVLGVLAHRGEIVAWTLHKKERDYLTFFEDQRIVEGAAAIVRASGFTGSCNFDLRLSDADDRFFFLECNPRFWASVGVSAWYGVDFLRIGMSIAQGLPIPGDLKRSVVGTTRLPNPDIIRYLKGVVRGRFPLVPGQLELPWRLLTDPLPLVWQKLNRRSAKEIDDTALVDAAFGPASSDRRWRIIASSGRPRNPDELNPSGRLQQPRLHLSVEDGKRADIPKRPGADDGVAHDYTPGHPLRPCSRCGTPS